MNLSKESLIVVMKTDDFLYLCGHNTIKALSTMIPTGKVFLKVNKKIHHLAFLNIVQYPGQ